MKGVGSRFGSGAGSGSFGQRCGSPTQVSVSSDSIASIRPGVDSRPRGGTPLEISLLSGIGVGRDCCVMRYETYCISQPKKMGEWHEANRHKKTAVQIYVTFNLSVW
jgi:hypothetical protein